MELQPDFSQEQQLVSFLIPFQQSCFIVRGLSSGNQLSHQMALSILQLGSPNLVAAASFLLTLSAPLYRHQHHPSQDHQLSAAALTPKNQPVKSKRLIFFCQTTFTVLCCSVVVILAIIPCHYQGQSS